MESNETAAIIAEIGVNHNGDLTTARKLLRTASETGATHAKIQVFEPRLLVASTAPLAQYQVKNGVNSASQMKMLSNLTLSKYDILKLEEDSSNLGIEMLATPFDLSSLNFLVTELQHTTVKIGSGDLTFHQLIFEAAKLGLNLILSTGMANLQEVREAVAVAAAGREVHQGTLPRNFVPSPSNLEKLQPSNALRDWLTLLHCTSSYPAPLDHLNISSLSQLATLGTRIGYSDHSASSHGSILAVAFGAEVFEKHLTLDQDADGPDHKASLEPQEFADYVNDIRIAEMALGAGVKEPQPSEENVKLVARRSLFASRQISVGEIIDEQNVVALRPGSGVSADTFYFLKNSRAQTSFETGDLIE